MEALAAERGWKRGVEIGLGQGMLFTRFLGLGIEMVGVDLGLRQHRADSLLTAVDLIEGANATLFWMPSVKAAPFIEDGWADFVFIDAAHSYKAVKADIAAWAPKVKPGGWLGGHDYHPSFPGVMQAVDEAFPKIDRLEGWIWTRA